MRRYRGLTLIELLVVKWPPYDAYSNQEPARGIRGHCGSGTER